MADPVQQVKLEFVQATLLEIKQELIDQRKILISLQIKVASHATLFGLVGGLLGAAGTTIVKALVAH